jgi:hypothetical protein|tara:strand:+ start:9829 stop:10026 length:198 start_codon:yes stop_codon:yes gene_type:complete
MPKSKYSAKQKKLAAVAEPRDSITGADFKAMKKEKSFKIGGAVSSGMHRGCGAVMDERRKRTKYS